MNAVDQQHFVKVFLMPACVVHQKMLRYEFHKVNHM